MPDIVRDAIVTEMSQAVYLSKPVGPAARPDISLSDQLTVIIRYASPADG